jgi:cytochrome c
MLRRKKFLLVLAAAIPFLAGCLSESESATIPSESQNLQEEAIVSGLPSISELAGTPELEIPPLPNLERAEISLGKEIYATHCASCHGQDLEGEPDWQVQMKTNPFEHRHMMKAVIPGTMATGS